MVSDKSEASAKDKVSRLVSLVLSLYIPCPASRKTAIVHLYYYNPSVTPTIAQQTCTTQLGHSGTGRLNISDGFDPIRKIDGSSHDAIYTQNKSSHTHRLIPTFPHISRSRCATCKRHFQFDRPRSMAAGKSLTLSCDLCPQESTARWSELHTLLLARYQCLTQSGWRPSCEIAN